MKIRQLRAALLGTIFATMVMAMPAVSSASDLPPGIDLSNAVQVEPPAGATPVLDESGGIGYEMPEGATGMTLSVSPLGSPTTSWTYDDPDGAESASVVAAARPGCDLFSRLPYRSGRTIGFPVTMKCNGDVIFFSPFSQGQIDISGRYRDFGAPGFDFRTGPGTAYATGLAGCNVRDSYRTKANGYVQFSRSRLLAYPRIYSKDRVINCN